LNSSRRRGSLSCVNSAGWASEPIPQFILPDGPAQDALAELASFSRAKFDEGGGRFRIHRLVQDVTRERQSAEERDRSLRSMLEVFNKAKCGDPQDVRSWPVWDPLRPHLSLVTTYADLYGIADPTTSLMTNWGVFLLAKARYGDAEPLMRRALAIDEASYGPEHPDVAIRLINLAQLLQATNWLDDAEPLMQLHLVMLFKFTRSTGHVHPPFETGMQKLSCFATSHGSSDEEVGWRLLSLGEDAGFDAGTYRPLLVELLR
jgi:hypothetical protein